jgi:hypothetical protein
MCSEPWEIKFNNEKVPDFQGPRTAQRIVFIHQILINFFVQAIFSRYCGSFDGWGCRSVAEHLPSMCKALGLIPNTEKNTCEYSKQR